MSTPFDQAIKAIHDQIQHLSSVKEHLISLRDSGNVLTHPNGVAASDHPKQIIRQPKTSLYVGMSALEAIEKAILANGKPMKTSDLVEALQEGGFTSASKNFSGMISSILSKTVSEGKGQIFKSGRGEYNVKGE